MAQQTKRVIYVTTPTTMTDEEIERIRQRWEELHSGVRNAPELIVMTGFTALLDAEYAVDDDEEDEDAA